MMCVKCAAFCDLRVALRIQFGHPSQVRAQVLVLQTCVDLRQLASPFGQGLTVMQPLNLSLNLSYLVKRWKAATPCLMFMQPSN